ncbi:MAG: glycerophosphodiester phosphodiesterase [Acidimicrobiia bacterium]|nr:glycerophosphodiester phosphodiesterase [Acidimicrobiia bacterium]MBV8559188.1 glycerophosphodiester phosphodiesterase [Acidimicrobiia bacterium]
MSPTSWPFLDWPYPIPFAHRGGASDKPENTMAAFQRAVELGYRYVETDAHLTADGVLLAFHDHVLDRVTDRTGVVAELPWSEIQKARVDGEPVPLLEDLLGTWPDIRVNIDPKHDAAVGPLVDTLAKCNAFDRVCVAAFSDRRLSKVRRTSGGRVCTALGPTAITRLRMASYGARTGRFAGGCVQVPTHIGKRVLVDRRFVDTAHRRGFPVHVWTIDERAQMQRLLDLGVDGIMTDRPGVLKELLTERGQWVA